MQTLYRQLSYIVCAAGLFLSAWIVIPAPTLFLLPLSVGAPEISSWLLGLNAVGAVLTFKDARKHSLSRLALSVSVTGLMICTLPLSQFTAVNQQAKTSMSRLGANYLATVPSAIQAQMRPQPLVLTELFSGISDHTVRHTSDIQFTVADGVPLSLDIYRPPQVGQYPAIVVIYGGAWQTGSPHQNEAFSRYMAARGYVVWAIAYRHAPRYRFPAQLEDVETALKFLHTHAAEYETNPHRVALLGRSAGAQLAMLAAYRSNPLPVQAVVDYYGPVDLAAGYDDPPHPNPMNTRTVLNALLGGSPRDVPELYQLASPIYLVTRSAPPSLLIYGGRDNVVQAKYGRMMYERLRSVGSKAVFLEIPWADHAFDAVFSGISNQLALYYTERFLAWALLSA